MSVTICPHKNLSDIFVAFATNDRLVRKNFLKILKVLHDSYQYILQKYLHFKDIFPNLLIVSFTYIKILVFQFSQLSKDESLKKMIYLLPIYAE